MDMQILFCAPEVSPFAKTGGLADVAGSLPASLQKLGCDVRIFTPLYRAVRETVGSLDPVAEDIVVPVGVHDYHVHFWQSRTESGVPVYFLEKDEFFDRAGLYGSPARGDYEDNAERFIAFCGAARQLCTAIDWFPQIFHLHDWQTGLVSSYFHTNWRYDPKLLRAGTVFTIHNIAYQGLFPAGYFGLTQLPPSVFSLQGIEFWGQCNFLKAGLVYSDFLTTVSPRYSKEIQTPEFGFGLEGLLKERGDSLAGILNGIDTKVWDPETDPLLPANFSAKDVSGKRICKETLCSELGFAEKDRSHPLIGMIGRLATQKGFDLVRQILPDLMEHPVNVVILGTGDAAIEEKLKELETLFPDRLRLLFAFDEALAHRIEAGADLFLMPSRYEPCGLNQMYSLRYGTIPVVHATGGLDDSVVDALERPNSGTGFKFREYGPRPFLNAVLSALALFKNKDKWQKMQRRAMGQDFSWDRSAREYIGIYEKVLSKRTGGWGTGPGRSDI